MKDSFNSFFDKIYVLTIRRNADRHEQLKQNLAGINYELFFGADGSTLDLAEMEANGEYNSSLFAKNTDTHYQKYLGRTLSVQPNSNVIACALSHKMAYEDMLKNNYERVLIMEDDAALRGNNIDSWPAIKAQLPADWDLIYLGRAWKHDNTWREKVKRSYIYPLLNSLNIRKYNHNLITNGFTKKYSKNLFVAGTHGTAHAYAITRRCAQFLVEQQTPIQNHADILFWEPHMDKRIKAFTSEPEIFTLSGAPSSIL